MDTVTDRLGLDKDAQLDALYSTVLNQMVVSMKQLESLLNASVA